MYVCMYVCMYTHVHCSYNNWEIGCRFPANLLPRLLPKQCWPHFEAWGGPPLVQKGLRGFGRSSNAGRAGLHLLWQVGNRGTSPGHCYWGWPKAIAAPKWFQTLWTFTNGSLGMFRLPFDEPYHMWMATEWTCKTIAYNWKTSQDDAVRCLVLIRSFL